MKEQNINCPKCGESISIDNVLTRQIEQRLKDDLDKKYQVKEKEWENKSEELRKQSCRIEEDKRMIEVTISQKVTDQLFSEKLKLVKDIRRQIETEQNEKTFLLEEQLKNKDEKLAQATKNEIELRKEKIKLQEDKQSFELEKIRQLEEEKTIIIEEASRKANEEQQYIIGQLKKQLTDAIAAKDNLARKLEQGSQQTQGEVLELALEGLLKSEFPHDEILPVPKGVSGADIVQKVKCRRGGDCGEIIWEFKKTKSWSEGWIQKLKDDQRAIKADIAVIVSIALPENVKGFIFRDGVWICDVKVMTALAVALRMNLISIANEKAMAVGKNEKMETLYSYLTGIEFKQRVEAIMEAFTCMEEGLRKERVAFEKIWSEREKQIKKVVSNTVGMYGDLSGLVALPQIKNLELNA